MDAEATAMLARLLELVETLTAKVAAWERLLPEPDTLAGKAIARRLRKAEHPTAADWFKEAR